MRVIDRWRCLLGASLSKVRRTARATSGDLGAATAGDLATLARWRYSVLAVGLVVAGGLGRVSLTDPGPDRIAAATAAVAAVGWAIGRLGIMLIVLGTGKVVSARTRGAWVAGTTVWVVAVVPLAAFIAWVASAGITLFALVRSGEGSTRARRAVLVAWGIQAAVTIAGWFAVNAWFATLLS